MKIGILISTGDPEIIWNAFRFANLCLNTNVNDEVSIFMHAKAVEYESCDSKQFNIKELAKTFVLSDGKLLACGKCLGFRGLEENEVCRQGQPERPVRNGYDERQTCLLLRCDVDVSFLITLLFLGLGGGFLSGLLGLGGAIFMIPLLLYVPPLLGVGQLDMKQVAAVSMVQVLSASLSGVIVHHKNRFVSKSSPALHGNSQCSRKFGRIYFFKADKERFLAGDICVYGSNCRHRHVYSEARTGGKHFSG